MAVKKLKVKLTAPVVTEPVASGSVKTQKAKGILALQMNVPNGLSVAALQQVRVYPYHEKPNYPFFARPCPLRPRHGFVESRLVKNDDEWKQVRTEVVLSKEADAEIVCMPFLTASWSGIVTPAGVAYGNGHDGATSGKNVRAIPAAAPTLPEFVSAYGLGEAMQLAGIQQCPYIELVCQKGVIEAVQLRDGPAVTLGTEMVKQDTTVGHVIEARPDMDLLDWEAQMKDAKGKTGVVVWHPGGALSSHFAVQAIEHSIPVVICPTAPAIGSVLKKTEWAPPKLTANDYKTLAKLVAWALEHATPALHRTEGVTLAIAALHAQAQWSGERHLLVLRAIGVTYMIRFAAAAILGELRHWKGVGPGRSGKPRLTELECEAKGASRNQVYEFAFERRALALAEKLKTAVVDFARPGWSGAYGGKKWRICAAVTAKLCVSLADFMKKPSEKKWSDVIARWNVAVNVAHNCGFMLDKFIAKDVMDLLARVPLVGLTTPLVGDLAILAERVGEHAEVTRMAESLMTAKLTEDEKKELLSGKALTPKTLPPWEGRCVCKQYAAGKTLVHLQVKLDPPIDRSYGAAYDLIVDDDVAQAMKQATLDAESLTGSGSRYARCQVSLEGGRLMLTYVSGGVEFLTALGSEAAQSAITELAKWPAMGGSDLTADDLNEEA